MKLYIYDKSRPHSHDLDTPYYNTTPLSIEGIKKHCTVVTNKDDADYFYMGQISEAYEELNPPILKEHFTFLDEIPKKHIFDLEGDWFHLNAPEWMLQCIKSGSSTKKENYVQPFCIRPCFSYLLLYLGQHNPTYELEFPDDKSFCFCGLPDQRGVRGNMAQCINKMGVKNQMQFNQFWGAKRSIDSPEVTNYMDLLINNLISLCPRGMGADTVRFYETCFFGRVPVVISDMAIMGEDFYDTSFVFKINPYLSIEDMTTELMKVNDTPYTELVERAKLARQYFQNVLIPYFKDPTQYFFDFLKRHNL